MRVRSQWWIYDKIEELQQEEQFIKIKDDKNQFIISAQTAQNRIKKIPAASVSHAGMKSKPFLVPNRDKDQLQITQLFVSDNIYN